MSGLAEAARSRRAQIVALSFSELMLLLVFMSIAFSFMSSEEGRHDIPKIQKELEEAQSELKQRRAEIATLKARVNDLDITNTKLRAHIESLGGASAEIPSSVFDAFTLEQLRALAKDQKLIIVELQRQLSELVKKMNGGKAPGLPICAVTDRYLIHFTLNTDGSVTGAPGWSSDLSFVASSVDGVNDLVDKGPVDPSSFRGAAGKVRAWGMSQPLPCTIRVSYKRLTTDAGVFEGQLKMLGEFFYVAAMK